MPGNDLNFNGVTFGASKSEPVFWIWNKSRWEKSIGGLVTLVFDCYDHDKTYHKLEEKGVTLYPSKTVVWGGKELFLKNPDGNIVLIL